MTCVCCYINMKRNNVLSGLEMGVAAITMVMQMLFVGLKANLCHLHASPDRWRV